MSWKRPPKGQEQLFQTPIPAAEKARASLRASAFKSLFSPVSDETFETLHGALAGWDNHYAENARTLLGQFEALYEASKTEGFTFAQLDETQLLAAERHVPLAKALVTNVERSGAMVFDEAVKGAVEAITRTTYQSNHVLKEAIRQEQTARAAGQGENTGRS